MYRALLIASSMGCWLLSACEGSATAVSTAMIGDGGAELALDPVVVETDPSLHPASLASSPSGATTFATPAPHIIGAARRTPSGAAIESDCRLDVPAGDCDRCPSSACRQVRLSLVVPPAEADWTMFCDEGDVFDEARIACICAGGGDALCQRAAADTVHGLLVLESMFGGRVPGIGERYRDASGLRGTVDELLHTWLSRVAGPPRTMRCDVPDREIAIARYEQNAQRVRMTGSCE